MNKVFFNQNSRTSNVIRASTISSVCGVISLLARFAFRTVFIRLLSKEYLGIEGLFTNILNILSLAELGLGSAITYQMYKPISENDVESVGRLMNYFKQIYRLIACTIMIAGLLCVPFLNYLIRDALAIEYINIRFIFLLFVFQTASSYLFSYKQTILSADQKQYVVSIIQCAIKMLQYIGQVIILICTHEYEAALIAGISISLISNVIVSYWVRCHYIQIFQVKDNIVDEERKKIWISLKAVLCHKIGGTILSSTDNIVLSKFVGLVATGMYSNYSMIIVGVSSLLNKVFGSFTASLGNAHISLSKEENYNIFMKLFLINLIFVGGSTLCLCILMNDFIELWAGEQYLLSNTTVIIISLQYFLEAVRITMISYTYGSGVFHRDKLRPFIEAALNLIISVALVKIIGIDGVFWGTIISHILTVFWREPYLLFKFEFESKADEFIYRYLGGTIFTAIMTILAKYIIESMFGYEKSLLTLIGKAVVCTSIYMLGVIIIYGRNKDFSYCIKKIRKRLDVKLTGSASRQR